MMKLHLLIILHGIMSQRTLKVRARSILGDKTSLKISIFGYGSSCLHIAIEMSL